MEDGRMDELQKVLLCRQVGIDKLLFLPTTLYSLFRIRARYAKYDRHSPVSQYCDDYTSDPGIYNVFLLNPIRYRQRKRILIIMIIVYINRDRILAL